MQFDKIRILLAEDSKADQQLFKEMLIESGIEIDKLITCEELKAAEDILHCEEFDIILLDFFLPDSVGLDSISKLRQQFSWIPIVIITGYDDRSIALQAINNGAQDYLIKGEFNAELLRKTIYYAIQRHKVSDELVQINKRLDSFVYTVSHDLRGPVKNLKVLMEIYQNSDDEHEKNDLLNHMSTSILKTDDIIEHLNEVLLMQNNPAPIEMVSFDEVAVEVLENLDQIVNATSAQIDIDFSSCPSTNFTKSQIYSLLYNLIFNALKYAKKDVTPQIVISSQKEGKFICLKVKDNGIGIESKYHDKIFRMFYRNNEKVDGKGIGLHIVKTIAENCGGSVKVESIPNTGSEFTIYLKEKPYDTTKKCIVN
ncbi:ATP-binding protein [Fulvivirgaceae bacterium BMA12]|uniref:histidine kinase n=1 Tax=Agaribacillus aureus TaxID=3051825 RepID=A0ABT8L9F5_9BACT|nr:ATP-binding protein [Fulvivirgaceae bacterium BMA12]